ncbi:MAG TPA: Uma2 family endonuclease [Actinoplanes sp.]|nr:Uma2 family endonuclease [Actinoplanes sp.]
MTTQLTERRAWVPDPERQRLADHTIEDVLTRPDEAPRVEVRAGLLVPVPPPTINHQRTVGLLWQWLSDHAPLGYLPCTNVGILIGLRDTFEPDLAVLRPPLVRGHHFFDPHQVALAVEVVTDDTQRRDRLEKPTEYAAAGIAHYWRVELDPLHVHAYDLVDGRYHRVADAASELVLSAPFPIRLPLPDITP